MVAASSQNEMEMMKDNGSEIRLSVCFFFLSKSVSADGSREQVIHLKPSAGLSSVHFLLKPPTRMTQCVTIFTKRSSISVNFSLMEPAVINSVGAVRVCERVLRVSGLSRPMKGKTKCKTRLILLSSHYI